MRRSWRELHLRVDAGTGRIVASPLTNRDVDDGSQVGPSLNRVEGPLACFTGDGAYDGEVVTASIGSRHLFIHEQGERTADTGGPDGMVKPHVGHRTEVDGRQLAAQGGHVHPRTGGRTADTGGPGGVVKPHVGHRTEVDGRQLAAQGGHVHPRTGK